jgi:N-methylhydantoinase B
MDSGGAGQFRGGLGVRRDYRILTDTARMAMIAERTTVAHWGLAGGLGGGLGGFVVNPETPQQREVNSRLGEVELTRGDVASVQTAGAGGFGDPRDRPVEKVLADVLEGKVSLGAARRDYDVHVDIASRSVRRVGERDQAAASEAEIAR